MDTVFLLNLCVGLLCLACDGKVRPTLNCGLKHFETVQYYSSKATQNSLHCHSPYLPCPAPSYVIALATRVLPMGEDGDQEERVAALTREEVAAPSVASVVMSSL